MATHEAGIVDQMQRRVIELSAGEIVRDERRAATARLDDADAGSARGEPRADVDEADARRAATPRCRAPQPIDEGP